LDSMLINTGSNLILEKKDRKGLNNF
jgi:hypothetical protein